MHLRIVLLFCTAAFVGAAEPGARLTNVSVRSTIGSGSDSLIVGFAVGGSGSKQVLVRAIGPSLSSLGVADAVADPELQLFNGTTLVAQNNDWSGTGALTSAFAAVGAFPLAGNSRDAAVSTALPPGGYTAQVRAAGGGTALLECYDADTANTAVTLRNVSARALVPAGGSLTLGFALTGTSLKTVFLRGIGPALESFGVTNALSNPQLRIFNSAGTLVGSNDDWSGTPGTIAVANAVGAFPLTPGTRDSAFMQALGPGVYTVQLSSVGDQAGVALIELYDVALTSSSTVALQPVSNPVPPLPPGVATRVDTLPRPISQANPVYPAELRGSGVLAEVILLFTVTAEGAVADPIVISATDVRFGNAALDALRQWRFEPARLGGQAVPVRMTIPAIFTPTSG